MFPERMEFPPSWNFIKGNFLKVTVTDSDTVPKKGQKNTKRFKSVVISGIKAIEGCYTICTYKSFFNLTVVL